MPRYPTCVRLAANGGEITALQYSITAAAPTNQPAPRLTAPGGQSKAPSMALNPTSPACLIIGVDSHVGAYLARLLDARGMSLAGAGTPEHLLRLGVANAVVAVNDADVPIAAAHSRLVFAIGAADAARADLIASSLAAAATAAQPPRFIHVADVADLDTVALRNLLHRVVKAREGGRIETANVLLEAHDSRLGPPDSLMARIIGAAWAAGQPVSAPAAMVPAIAEIIETGPRDWGWTPEYVDAVQRLATRPALVDLVVATGHRLSAADIAEHAFGFFRRKAGDHVRIIGDGAAIKPIDPAPVKAATGWSASTYGRDLVRAICEGAGDRTVAG